MRIVDFEFKCTLTEKKSIKKSMNKKLYASLESSDKFHLEELTYQNKLILSKTLINSENLLSKYCEGEVARYK